jgi:hypothetical protein
MFITVLRKNVGTIIAIFGFLLLCIMTFGNLGEISSAEYWRGVTQNLTSIGFMTVSLTLIQVSIKQGVAEQALQRGLNTDRTQEMYTKHRDAIKVVSEKTVYLPYFLQMYNKRHTLLAKREFLVDNNLSSEKALYELNNKKLIKKYEKISIQITSGRIKWATTDIMYNSKGQIITLQEHRNKRIVQGIIISIVFMIGMTLLTRGLFFNMTEEPLWQKFVKLATYMISITISSILSVIKEYEKGAFGVPNDLEEINEIWYEFQRWIVPAWVLKEVTELDNTKEVGNREVSKDKQNNNDKGTDLQNEQKKVEDVRVARSNSLVCVSSTDDSVLRVYDTELGR